MLSIADTSPLNYLVLIRQIDIVPLLFGRISIRSAVRDELSDPMTPAVVRAWIAAPPDWLSINSVSAAMDASLARLDDGEREAIALASAIKAELLLMDDRPGVAVARSRGLQVTGTLGALDRAALHGMINLPEAITALRTTTFHAHDQLLAGLLARDRQRRREP